MERKYKISINIPIFMISMLILLVIFCKYNIESRMGYIIFPVEFIFAFVLYSRQTEDGRLNGVSVRRVIYVYFFFMIYRIFVSALITGSLYDGTKKILYYEVGVLFLLYFAVCLTNAEDIIITLRNIGIVNAVLGVYETITRSSIFMRFIDVENRIQFSNLLGTENNRARTIFFHPIICAVFCTYIWCILLYYPMKGKWINTISQIALIICLMGTKSRSSWISFAIVNVIYLVQRLSKKKGTIEIGNIFYGLVFAIFMIVIFIIQRDYILSAGRVLLNRWMLVLDADDAGNYNRITMIRNGLQDFAGWGVLSKIFGKGYLYAYNLLQRHSIRGWTTAVDNSYLTALLDYGIGGLLFLFYFIYISIKSIHSRSRLHKMCGLSILSLFISGFFYEMFSWFTPNFLLALSFCLISVHFEENDSFDCNTEVNGTIMTDIM
ncbi:MAG: O-antigen ligase family protein [Lachnospiraceae bacterium]|nr:O-antigen ligase family protein [Lachnospiraceae bacterium]MBQ8947989.1 O-antigen ligase family protein [Lachnospiraceae bacterium]